MHAAAPSRWRWTVAAGGAIIVLVALAVVFLRPGRSPSDLRRISGQNILLITIDTLRVDALGSYGGAAATPALDRLAAEGVRFDFAHAHAVMTLPSHATILTGTYPFQHGVRDNSGYRLPTGARTAATILKRAGYATAAFVGAFTLDSRFGLNAGFDVYDDHYGEGQGPADLNIPERPASVVVPLARKWISGSAKPWFVWVHVFDPHAPYQPPPPFDTQYADRPYYGEVAATDAALAPLLDDVRNLTDPTLVVVTGDHGEGLGEHGEQAHGLFAYESTLRIPLIIAEIGRRAAGSSPVPTAQPSPAGEVCSVPVRHVDLLPTILDAVGQPVPADLPGRTLLPRKERVAGSPPRDTYFEAMYGMLEHGWAPLTGVLVGRDKFVDLPIAERYDLASDPKEQSNLFGRSPERDRLLDAALASFGSALPGSRVTEDPEAVARLRALGYVSGGAPAKARYTEADDPKNLVEFDLAIHRAVDASVAGRAAEAAAIFQQVIDRRPDMAVAYRRLALLEWQQGDAAGAVDVLRRAVARGVTDVRALTELGQYLTDAGRVSEGIRVLEPLSHNPAAEAGTLNALGIAYARAARREDARRVFERMVEAAPKSSAPFENLGVLALEQGDVAGARKYFDLAIELAPGSARAHMGAGAAAFESGDRQAAYEEWKRAVQLDSTNLDALYSLGVNLARDGRMDEARSYLDQFLRTTPPSSRADQRREVSGLLRSGR